MTITPPNSNSGLTAPAPKETPLKTNRTHGADYRYGGLRKARVAVLEELGSVPVVDLDWFLSYLLPENDLNINNVLEELVSSGAREQERWTVFPKTPWPPNSGEDQVFRCFEDVVDQIANVIGHLNTSPPSRISCYVSQPRKAPASLRNNMSRPDGFFKLVNINVQESDWWAIIGPGEFKLSTSNAASRDNVGKIIWSLHHIMREDARRRFTFGFTIEGTQTRFWFASRSVILTSEPFDFMTEPGPLIQMVNFLTYATEEQLGYDTTIHRILGSKGQLIIDINGRKFQTDGILADYSADSLLGRGTRVWRGFFQDAPGKPAVLKDCWAECDRDLEGDVLTTLRGEYYKLPEDSRKHNFDDYFLTIITHGWVRLAGEADDTRAMMKNVTLPTIKERLILTDHITESDREKRSHLPPHAASSGLGPSPEEVMRVAHYDIKWRCHYRISFNELAKPLYDVVELGDHMRALRDAIIGIGILHELGYVHRDISSGNVLFHGGRGKLSDLEYCKPFNSQGGGHDVRTGTRHFMSVEVAAGRRLFVPDKTVQSLFAGSVGNDDDDDGEAYQEPPFQFFILHDIESVWWLLAFALFANGVQGEPSDTAREDRQKNNAEDMFPMILYSTIRRDAFISSPIFLGMKDNLPSILHPLFKTADTLRRRLKKQYYIAEWTESLDQTHVPYILSVFFQMLDEAIKLSGNIILIPGLKFDHKRPAEEAGDDGGEGSAKKIPRHV